MLKLASVGIMTMAVIEARLSIAAFDVMPWPFR